MKEVLVATAKYCWHQVNITYIYIYTHKYIHDSPISFSFICMVAYSHLLKEMGYVVICLILDMPKL